VARQVHHLAQAAEVLAGQALLEGLVDGERPRRRSALSAGRCFLSHESAIDLLRLSHRPLPFPPNTGACMTMRPDGPSFRLSLPAQCDPYAPGSGILAHGSRASMAGSRLPRGIPAQTCPPPIYLINSTTQYHV